LYTDRDSLVQKIHATPAMASIATTGGGSSIFPTLLERGNGSKTLIGGFIPYDPAEHEEFLGGKSDRWVAEADARALAMSAFLKAQKKKPGVFVIGIGATSSLMRVERDPDGKIMTERKGRKHSIYVAMQSSRRTITHSLVYENTHLPLNFTDPLDIRVAEERLTADLILNLLAEGCAIPERVETGAEDLLVCKEATAAEIHPELASVLFGTKNYVAVTCGENLIAPMPNYSPPKGLLPGSYNPIHQGHRKMRAELLDYLRLQDPEPVVGYEITVQNADKPPIDYLSLKDRLATIADSLEHSPVYLTNKAKFIDKARLFVHCSFGCGYDTAVRIVDSKYYENSEERRDFALRDMRDHGARFVVFGRKDPVSGQFLTLNDIEDAPEFSKMAIAIHEVRFREDVSSSEIRNLKPEAQ
jgi:hypothetical protein